VSFPNKEDRRHKVSWSLYQTVAAQDDRHAWLEWAAAEGWSRSKLRAEVLAANTEVAGPGEIIEYAAEAEDELDAEAVMEAVADIVEGEVILGRELSNDAGGPGGFANWLKMALHSDMYRQLIKHRGEGAAMVAQTLTNVDPDEVRSLGLFLLEVNKALKAEAVTA
jgi:hypothetical protein